MAYVAKGNVVKVSIGSASGNRVARIIRQGDVLPDGVDESVIARLTSRGLIEELPSAEDLAEVLDTERIAQEAAAKAQFDKAVDAAAVKLVADRDAAAAKTAAAQTAPATKPAGK